MFNDSGSEARATSNDFMYVRPELRKVKSKVVQEHQWLSNLTSDPVRTRPLLFDMIMRVLMNSKGLNLTEEDWPPTSCFATFALSRFVTTTTTAAPSRFTRRQTIEAV